MLAGSYIIISLDPGGSSDPAGLATLLVFKRDRITHTKVIELLAKPPIMTAQMHIQLVMDAISRMAIKYIRPPCALWSTCPPMRRSATCSLTRCHVIR